MHIHKTKQNKTKRSWSLQNQPLPQYIEQATLFISLEKWIMIHLLVVLSHHIIIVFPRILALLWANKEKEQKEDFGAICYFSLPWWFLLPTTSFNVQHPTPRITAIFMGSSSGLTVLPHHKQNASISKYSTRRHHFILQSLARHKGCSTAAPLYKQDPKDVK